MTDIFVSYKRDDRDAVEQLVRVLEADFDVWWDPEIAPGERYSKVIREALDGAACVVVAWSHLSVDSPWVQDEAGIARDRGVLVPVSIDGVEPPLGFRQLQTVELADWTGASSDPRIKQLLIGIRRLVGPRDPAAKRPAAERRISPMRKARKVVRLWWAIGAMIGASAAAATLAAGMVFYFLERPQPVVVHTPSSLAGVAYREFNTDCMAPAVCPTMLVVLTGSFDMGSIDNEPQRGNDEGPQHHVSISKVFAAGKFPVTFDEWDYCYAQKGCTILPSDNNFGRGTHPVINISWQDAQDYVKWLSKSTGKSYRLLTEAEREYITRAGTTTPFWWGPRVSTDQSNYDGTQKYSDEPVGRYRMATVPVDTFGPNPWGFYQVSGNTWDWVEDCYHDSYDGAPTDASAWTKGADCSRRVLRGGSWGSQPRNVRSAARWKQPVDTREPYYGFRVARECDEKCSR
jgi:formylglycine-generating enzyme required for sulfatase activity